MATKSRWGPDENLVQSIPTTVGTTMLSLTVGCGFLVWLAVVVPADLLILFLAPAVTAFSIAIGLLALLKLAVSVVTR
jgi:hypothetical protein